MALALRPYVTTAGVAVLCVGLIQVTPMAVARIEQRAVQLAAAEDTIDLVGPIDAAVSSLGGLGGDFGGVLPSLGDLSGTFADGASSLSGLDSLFDPEFWQSFWSLLAEDPLTSFTMLEEAIVQLPLIAPIAGALGLFVVLPVSLLLAWGWSLISDALGIQPFAAAAEGLGTSLQGVYGAALTGVIDPALPAGVDTALENITSVFADAAGALDPTTLVQDVSTALDPSAVTSILDLNPIADIATVIDPAAVADIGTVLSTSTIPDLGEILPGLVP